MLSLALFCTIFTVTRCSKYKLTDFPYCDDSFELKYSRCVVRDVCATTDKEFVRYVQTCKTTFGRQAATYSKYAANTKCVVEKAAGLLRKKGKTEGVHVICDRKKKLGDLMNIATQKRFQLDEGLQFCTDKKGRTSDICGTNCIDLNDPDASEGGMESVCRAQGRSGHIPGQTMVCPSDHDFNPSGIGFFGVCGKHVSDRGLAYYSDIDLKRSRRMPLTGDHPYETSGKYYWNEFTIGGLFGGTTVTIIILIFCIGLVCGMCIFWGYTQRNAWE
eukprot:812171_1